MLTGIRKYRYYVLGRRAIKKLVREFTKHNKPLKIIVGSGGTQFTGWIPTDIPHFDITMSAHWSDLFSADSIQHILAEHVLEHLTLDQVKAFLRNAQPYLKNGGKIRVAVPDEFNRDTLYYEGVKPGGSDVGSDDHKIFLNIEIVKKLANEFSYSLNPLEFYDENGMFHLMDYSFVDGYVARSRKNNFQYPPIPNYSSLIFDLIKK